MKKVFIASSSEALGYATATKELLEEKVNEKEIIRATVWKDAEWEIGNNILQSLINLKNYYDKAIFIFHPDDDLNFRNNELKSVRDNVIFEFGLFGGIMGFDNCYALVPKNIRIKKPSDLLGIITAQYEYEKNTDHSNQLRPAIKKLKETIWSSEKKRNDYLVRGDYRKSIVDYAIHTNLIDFTLYNNWVEGIKKGSRVLEDLLYWDRGTAEKWLRYEKITVKDHNHIIDLSAEVAKISKSSVDVISLGPGSADKDKIILQSIRKNGNINWYYPVDVSSHILNNALKNITSYFDDRDVKVKGLRANFYSLENLKFVYQYNRSRNIFLLLGNTLGNYNESSLLNNIINSMMKHDYLVIEVNKDMGEDKNSIFHDSELLQEFIVQPLVAFGIKPELNHLKFEKNINERSQVADSIRFGANYHLNDKEREILQSNNNMITITYSTLYKLDTLKDFFVQSGFEIIYSKEYEKHLGFVLQVN
ncbi:L-histidine N(alpha)-methyltransferase [Marivirga sp.]|uniref:L-histidine N(alpha)-methyltransferase n=1 Tax=Marivirga sp. TaxID=2018662 RepID=UPI003DA6E8F4